MLKKVQQVLGLFQFVLLFLLLAPTETWVGGAKLAAYMMPIVPSIGLLRDLMARNEGLDWGGVGDRASQWPVLLYPRYFSVSLGRRKGKAAGKFGRILSQQKRSTKEIVF